MRRPSGSLAFALLTLAGVSGCGSKDAPAVSDVTSSLLGPSTGSYRAAFR